VILIASGGWLTIAVTAPELHFYFRRLDASEGERTHVEK
jgi:hypothetical protein